jgi:hypothetical protein
MMRIFCIAAVMAITSSFVFSQEEGLPQPSKEHELLKANLGTRTGQMKMWIRGQDAAPLVMPFTETNTSILNGFWVETKFKAGPYMGRGMSGFDPIKKKYVGTWTNNMAPYMSVMEGTYDEKSKEITMEFRDYDAVSGKLTDMKSVTSLAPGKPETMTMYKKDAKTQKFITAFVMTYDAEKKE